MEIDPLISARNYFWLGNYDLALQDATNVTPANDRVGIDRDVLINRCFIGKGESDVVLKNISTDSGLDLLAVRMLAEMISHPEKEEEMLNAYASLLADDTCNGNAVLQLMAGAAFSKAGQNDQALRCLRMEHDLEQCALRVRIFLSIHRQDLASDELGVMQNIDVDSSLAQLAEVWCYLASGDRLKCQDAVHILIDQMEKTISSPSLLCTMGMIHMVLERYDEAEKYLTEAIAKAPNDPDIITNMMCWNANMRRPIADTVALLERLEKVDPKNPLLAEYKSCFGTFDAIFKKYHQHCLVVLHSNTFLPLSSL